MFIALFRFTLFIPDISVMSSLHSLIDHILIQILHYLPVEDILSLRLTCSYLHSVSKCKAFYDRIQLTLKSLQSSHLHILKNILENPIRLKLPPLDKSMFVTIAGVLREIEDVSIDIKDLKWICKHCKNIRRLVIRFDFGLICHLKLDLEQIAKFHCLSELNDLDELHFTSAHSVKYTADVITFRHYTQSMLNDVLENASSITKIGFHNIEFKDHDNKLTHKTRINVRNSSHINHWTFENFYCWENIFEFPPSVVSLEMREARYINLNLAQSKMENLVLHNARFRCKAFNFKNLKTLELSGVLKEMSLSCMYDLDFCAEVENLKLSDLYCDHAFSAMYMSLFTSKVKILALENIYRMNETVMEKILERCPSLVKLSLKKIPNVSTVFVRFIRFSKPNMKLTVDNVTITFKNWKRALQHLAAGSSGE